MTAPTTPVDGRSQPLFSTESPHALVLRWLVPLRFLAAAGQAAALLFAAQVMRVDLPYRALWLIPAATVLSNLVLLRRGWSSAQARLLAPATLIFDSFLFTALLYLTGGPDNPFSALYTVHVAMAAMTGSARATWLVAGLSAAGYAAVFRWHDTYHFWHGPIAPGSEIGLHAVGMWVAVTVVAIVITYFIVKITNTLRAQEASLRRVARFGARRLAPTPPGRMRHVVAGSGYASVLGTASVPRTWRARCPTRSRSRSPIRSR